MQPLCMDELLPPDEYSARRREFFDEHRRYVERYRRVRIGPRLTLVFENRKTLWYRVQEVIRISRVAERRDMQQELNLYNRLLPGKGLLQAAFLIEIVDHGNLSQELATWKNLEGRQLRLQIGGQSFPSRLVTPGAVGTAHWVQFHCDDALGELLGDASREAYFTFDNGNYRHQSEAISESMRSSLLEDVELAPVG